MGRRNWLAADVDESERLRLSSGYRGEQGAATCFGAMRCAGCGSTAVHRIAWRGAECLGVEEMPLDCVCGERRFLYPWEH